MWQFCARVFWLEELCGPDLCCLLSRVSVAETLSATPRISLLSVLFRTSAAHPSATMSSRAVPVSGVERSVNCIADCHASKDVSIHAYAYMAANLLVVLCFSFSVLSVVSLCRKRPCRGQTNNKPRISFSSRRSATTLIRRWRRTGRWATVGAPGRVSGLSPQWWRRRGKVGP